MKNYEFKFQCLHSLETRKDAALRILSKYPNRLPIIVEKNKNCTNLPDMDKHKFLVPSELTVGQFLFVIRKRLNLSSEMGIFCFINEILPSTSEIIGSIYCQCKDDDQFLYICYTGENTFG